MTEVKQSAKAQSSTVTVADVREELLDEIREWLYQWRDLPPQGSPGWLAMRGKTIGGSELDELINNESSVVALKAGLKQIPTVLAMTWGSVLEPVMRLLSTAIFDTPVYEASSIPSVEVKGKTFSMDGIGVVRFILRGESTRGESTTLTPPAPPTSKERGLGGSSRELGLDSDTPCECKEELSLEIASDKIERVPVLTRKVMAYLKTLFEYKLLWSRKIVHGQVFNKYVPQVKSGLCDLGIPDIALYMEGVMRICKVGQMNKTGDVNTSIHSPYGRDAHALALCYVLVTLPEESAGLEPPHGYINKWLRAGENDFGGLETQGELNTLLLHIKKGYFRATFGRIAVFGDRLRERIPFLTDQKWQIPQDTPQSVFADYIKRKSQIPSTERYIGILPLKILDLNIVPVHKEPGYTKGFETEITQCLEKCQRLCALDSINDRWSEFLQMYPRDKEFSVPETVAGMDAYID